MSADKKNKSKNSFLKTNKRRFKKAVTFLRNGVFCQQLWRFFLSRQFVRRRVKSRAERLWPIEDKKIVFATFSNSFNCNPAAIARTLADRNYPGKLVFLVHKSLLSELKNSEIGKKIEFVDVWSWQGLREAATAKIMLENAQVFLWPSFVRKRPGQIYINTWHGSLGIKKLNTAVGLKSRSKLSKKYTDYCITNSDFEDDVLETSFFQGIPKVRLGHARNDIFFQSEETLNDIRTECRQMFDLPESCKIALYAPTFREKGFYKGFLEIDYGYLAEILSQKFGGEWKILVKLHPHDAKRMREANLELPAPAINANKYADINRLLQVTDLGISDYSSWIFDYIHMRRPGFIYAPDIDEYKRGFYYPLTDAPFPVAESEQQFYDAILNFDETKYLADVEAFLDKMGCVDDGKSCARIADFIEDIVSGKNITEN